MADTPDNARPQVVFFGSGPVAAASLELLLGWCDVEAVITKPQPLHHRQTFPVIAVAQAHGLPLRYATNRRELDGLMAEARFTSQTAALIDYGIIVSQAVIDAFPLGIINSHFSLLPEWRGADPITFSILSGQAETGVSLMLLVQAMDEGPLLAYGSYQLSADITTPRLTDDLIDLSDQLLRHELPRYLAGETVLTSQDVTGRQVSYSRKLTKQDGELDFNKPASQLEREIRAFIEWPKSRTKLAGKDVVITKAHVEPQSDQKAETGAAYATADKGIAIPTGDGQLVIDELKPAGKPAMTAAAFLAGNVL